MPAAAESGPIADYAASFPPAVRKILLKLRDLCRDEAPEAVETIKYAIPTFTLGRNLVHFAAFDRHIGLYPAPSAIVRFDDELVDYERAKGSIRFPLDRPLPFELIRRIVRFRVEEERAFAAGKPSRSRKKSADTPVRSEPSPPKRATVAKSKAASSAAKSPSGRKSTATKRSTAKRSTTKTSPPKKAPSRASTSRSAARPKRDA